VALVTLTAPMIVNKIVLVHGVEHLKMMTVEFVVVITQAVLTVLVYQMAVT
jgi:hypothetical protein